MNLFGMRVIESPYITPVPTIQVRHDVPMTDEGRAKMNAWLLEMFGTKEVAYIWQNNIFMKPEHVVMLRNFK